jgi:competence protein ComEC
VTGPSPAFLAPVGRGVPPIGGAGAPSAQARSGHLIGALRPAALLLLATLLACGPPAPPADADGPAAADLGAADLLGPSTGEATRVDDEAGLLPGSPRLRVALVNVGQGDGLVLWLPGGAVLALDGGPQQDGAYAAFLRRAGVTRLDYAVLSHAHLDHYSGLTTALSLLPADCAARVFDPGFDRQSVAGYRAFRDAAGCRYRPAEEGVDLGLDPAVEVRVLAASPRPFPDGSSTGVNNTSVVLRVRYHDFSILLGGDTEHQAEQALWARAGQALRSTVMKVAHHGSCDSTGTTLLRGVAPQLALLSLGAGNSYGHPHCQTMGRLGASPARWLRTDRNGTVEIITDGARWTVRRERGAESDPACPRDCASPLDF